MAATLIFSVQQARGGAAVDHDTLSTLDGSDLDGGSERMNNLGTESRKGVGACRRSATPLQLALVLRGRD
jgi:hypothetical protein